MEKTFAAILAIIIVVSAFSMCSSAFAKPFMNWKTNFHMPQASDRPNQSTFVRFDGVATAWGTDDMNGTIQAQSRSVFNVKGLREGATAAAIFTNSTSRPISAIRTKQNFTYVFYTAKLVEESESSLSTPNSNYFLSGTWNVFNVTASVNFTTNANGDVTGLNRSQNAVALASKVHGELKVTDNWSKFTLTIGDLAPITGSVYRQRTSSMSFNPFIINGDGSRTVTKADVQSLAKAYGAAPGWGNYDQRMDYNDNLKIDIADIATAAANLNSA